MATTHFYRGWHYTFDKFAPVSGQWRATRHGVGMNANNEKLLKRMIDQRLYDEEEARKKREE